jgi:hypothetical protein
MKKVLAAALVAATGVFAACSMAEEPESYSEQGKSTKVAKAAKGKKKAKQDAAPKWMAQMNEVRMGMSMAEVKSLLGKPDDTTASESEFMGDTTTLDMWTYGDMLDDRDGDDVWSLSFTDGKLDGKTRI